MPWVIGGGGRLLSTTRHLGEREICVVFCLALDWFLGFTLYFLLGAVGSRSLLHRNWLALLEV